MQLPIAQDMNAYHATLLTWATLAQGAAALVLICGVAWQLVNTHFTRKDSIRIVESKIEDLARSHAQSNKELASLALLISDNRPDRIAASIENVERELKAINFKLAELTLASALDKSEREHLAEDLRSLEKRLVK